MFPTNSVVISDIDKRPDTQDVMRTYVYSNITASANKTNTPNNNIPIMVDITREVGRCDIEPTPALTE